AMVAVGLPMAGSLALAASFVVFAATTASVAALAAQVTEHARGASGLAVTVLAAFFVMRAAGDVGNAALSWFSPMGWAIAVRPFGGERWAILLLPLGVAFAVAVAALLLVDRRDVGAGLRPARPGRGGPRPHGG
ncbi:MAG: ABC transporter permease, partial [Actinomycetota bacterium]|nr:ABC transporter permease [Actinomycetota bacterium]